MNKSKVSEMWKSYFKMCLFAFVIFSLDCGIVLGSSFSTAQRTSDDHVQYDPQFQVVGNKAYFVWLGHDGINYAPPGQKGPNYAQIWTAEMNIDGTGWEATKRTSTDCAKDEPQLQVVGNKIYYVWLECCHSNFAQITTAEMNIDGTGWSSAKRTDSAYLRYEQQFEVVNDKIYYLWVQGDDSGSRQIWTGEMNTNGTGWSATKRSASVFGVNNPQFQVINEKLYYVWCERDDWNISQITTAEMNIDGAGWSSAKRTDSAYLKYYPQFQVVGEKAYYVWAEQDDSYITQIWTGEMNIDGSGWSATKRTNSAYDKYVPQLQVAVTKIHYVYVGYGLDYPPFFQIWTGKMNTSGTGWLARERTSSPYNKLDVQLQSVGDKIYYIWYEDDDSFDTQIWTAVVNSDLTYVPCGLHTPCCNTIQDAINFTGSGGTIIIWQSTYEEGILLNESKTLTLQGWDSTFRNPSIITINGGMVINDGTLVLDMGAFVLH